MQLGDGLIVEEVNFSAVERQEIGLLGQLFVFRQLGIVLLKGGQVVVGRQVGLAEEDVEAAEVVVEQGAGVIVHAGLADLGAEQLLGFLVVALKIISSKWDMNMQRSSG